MSAPRRRPEASGEAQADVTSVDIDGRRVRVVVRVSVDAVEHVGRLWFSGLADSRDAAIPDRGTISGRTSEEVILLARRLTDRDLAARYRRAVASRRRFGRLRDTTDELLRRIRYLNHLAVSMRSGTIDVEGAAQEIDATEQQLHELVRRLRDAAGVEDPQA